MTDRTGNRATRAARPKLPPKKAAGPAGPRVRLSRLWAVALIFALLLLGGWQLLRIRSEAARADNPGNLSGKGSAAARPSDAQTTAPVQPGPDSLPGRDAVRPVPRRASDQELAAQLPPGAEIGRAHV